MSMAGLSRYAAFVICVALLAMSAVSTPAWPWAWVPVALFGALSLLGVRDLLQRRHLAPAHRYPVIG